MGQGLADAIGAEQADTTVEYSVCFVLEQVWDSRH